MGEFRQGNTAVFRIFDTRSAVENGVDMLKASGNRNSDISVLMSEGPSTQDFAYKKATKAF